MRVPTKWRKLTQGECLRLSLLACRMAQIDRTAADLMSRIAEGDDTACLGLVDRLHEIGRHEQAERLNTLLSTAE